MKGRRMLQFLLVLAVFLLGFKQSSSFFDRLVNAALEQTKKEVNYVPDYVQIAYPNGDVPPNTGVCTDLVIRAYRLVGIDLQKEVHEDMVLHFNEYPSLWKLKKPDSNIDHRRVPNLMTYFKRQNAQLSLGQKPEDYKPGDLVCWNLQNRHVMSGITHIGLVVNKRSEDGKRYQIAHNIGAGNRVEDLLFTYTIIGHFRFSH